MADFPTLRAISGGHDQAARQSPAAEPPSVPVPDRTPVSIPDGSEDRARPELVRPTPVRPLHPARPGGTAEPLWREVLGRRLRERRLDLGETLARTAGRAGISPQYLSEIERGRKEPSSEMIAALTGALGTTLGELAATVADDLQRATRLTSFGRPDDTASVGRPTDTMLLAA